MIILNIEQIVIIRKNRYDKKENRDGHGVLFWLATLLETFRRFVYRVALLTYGV